jgi:DNA-binding transcriptional LysR family regulator
MYAFKVEQLKPGPLTLSCSESIMMYWLIPRLPRFQDANTDVELRFKMGFGSTDFVRDNISVAIRLSTIEPPQGVLTYDITTEQIGVVCSAEHLRNHRLKAPADLRRARLRVSKTRPAAWKDWIASSASEPMEPHIASALDHFYLLIQAAKCGLGVASVPRMLVHDDLASGALVAPFGFVPGPNKLSLWVAPHLARRPDTIKLVGWLNRQLRASEK